MADSSSQDRTERATPKRVRDARKQGQLPRSRELASLIVVAAGVLALMATGMSLAPAAAQWMQASLNPPAELAAVDLPAYFGQRLLAAFRIIMPLLTLALLAAVAAPLLLGGWNVSFEALQPKLERIDPFKGLARMFSAQSAVELFKAVMKAVVIGSVAGLYLWTHLDDLMALGRAPLALAMQQGLHLALQCLLWLAGALLLIALVDVPFQLWSYAKQLRMTKQEIKQEFKEAEGQPEVKGRQRRLQQEVANRRMMQDLPTADVVIVNPTHYAVALKYTAAQMGAPRVIAKGRDELAAQIREAARQHRIAIVSAPSLARALYRGARIGDEIPAPLFSAVAQVLVYVYQLRDFAAGRGAGTRPAPPLPGDVPGGEPDPA